MCSIEGMSKDKLKKKESSDEGEGDTPVPIPNTEVKPFSADGTWLETTWESKTSLVSKERAHRLMSFFLFSRKVRL